jgi:ribose/xylose/arabinose/galactoside ABC-type transport system permease subunit
VSARAELAASPLRRFGIVRLGQPAAITLAVLVICAVMALISEPFRSYDNIYNDSRNFGFIAIMGMGQMLVIITGGIDLSVGSVMGLVGIVTGLTLQAGYPLWAGVGAGMGVALLCGLINGYAIARFKLSPFVVTLIMLSVARSQALVLSNNKMIYQFGPDEKLFGELGGGSLFGIPSVVIAMALIAVVLTVVLANTSWGRYVYAIGGNEQAALLTGIPVVAVKVSVYVLSSLSALTDLLAKYPKIDAVLDAGGAPQMEVKAYKELMGKYKDRMDKKDLVMLFVETLPMQMDDLKAGLSHGQVGQRPFEMGYKAIYLLNDLTQGKTISDPVTIGLDVCTPETIDTCKKQ